MAMTASVKDELSRLSVSKPCCRKAEVSAILRFAGGLHISAGKIMVEIELDTAQAARRIRKDIADVYGHDSDLAVISAGGLRKGSRYLVRVIKDGDALARQTGLVDSHGRPVRGLPPQVVSAGICDAESAWRGAFLAHGSLTEPGRSSALEITCPGPEAALALVGAARRLGITAKAREVRGVDRVVIRDGDAMAGPTPVSALIHAATMVTAGVYLITRSNFIFDAAPTAQLMVVIVGGITLLFGAIIGTAKDDIKKALAASTMSQIGYMILATGLGPIGYAFAIMHLLTHGFFKASMFLGAGSVMHGMKDEVNMRRYGGIGKFMPITALTFGLGYLAIIGVPPFAGFYSKDKIIETAFNAGRSYRDLILLFYNLFISLVLLLSSF